MTRISKNFTLDELCASETAKKMGINNVPNQEQICNLCALTHHVLQPLRDAMGKAITINSGFRSVELNRKVGGQKNSQHLKGEAADIAIGTIENGEKMIAIIKKLPFDQLIWERNTSNVYWIHVSYRSDGQNRHQYIADLLKK